MARTSSRHECPPSVMALVRTVHAAGLATAQWPRVLAQLGTALDARVVALSYHAFASGAESAIFESPDDAHFSQAMTAFSARNPWFLSSAEYVAGRVMTGDELISHNDLRRTDFYQAFLQPRGLLHRLCGVVARHACGTHILSAYRAETQDGFGPGEKALLELLLADITLSLESQWRWQEADDLAHALLSLSDHDPNPVVLLTAEAEMIYRNLAADQLLARGVGLRLSGTRLVAASTPEQRLLREMIARVAESDPSNCTAMPCMVTLSCTPPMPPLVAVLRAAGQVFTRRIGTTRGLAMLSIRDGNARHDPASCVLARRYELTAAQSRICALVVAGQHPASIASSLHVSENTVRSHLKQIFHKTDTHGQMDLLHLHAQVCLTLP